MHTTDHERAEISGSLEANDYAGAMAVLTRRLDGWQVEEVTLKDLGSEDPADWDYEGRGEYVEDLRRYAYTAKAHRYVRVPALEPAI